MREIEVTIWKHPIKWFKWYYGWKKYESSRIFKNKFGDMK